jgi:serine/threonine protein kinase
MNFTLPPEAGLLGKTLAGKYQLMQVRAAGAFGTVFLAHQYFCRHFVRPVAVKVSRQTGLTEETAPYLFSDALILARVVAKAPPEGRQHLVAIHDMGLLPEQEGRGFLVLEYVDGLPLLAHIQAAGRLGVATGLRYARELCRGLAVLHAQGAVHRDLKPDNVLVDRTGLLRLVDFGLASFTDPQLGFAPGEVGTFTYMAPETLGGRATPAADVYSLGLLLYELFTGGGPHLVAPWPKPGEDRAGALTARIKLGLYFPPPSQVHNEIRNDYRWLDGLILRCLEVDPEHRFRDAAEVLAAIEAGGAPATERWVARQTETPPPAPAAEGDELIREGRRLLAAGRFAEAVDLLDVHRPAEWQALDQRGGRILRLLARAYLGWGNLQAARECLEQLRSAGPGLLPRQEQAAALTDLVKCYHALGEREQAQRCRQEAKKHLGP